ncbi:hypothetical protein H1C71_017120 [Ictidomys tridecemlineatus]|nr:hypothetical protein H1C71_017120 [Ictidomys tridecemlineatus]
MAASSENTVLGILLLIQGKTRHALPGREKHAGNLGEKVVLLILNFFFFWWCWGLNPGPYACKASALPTEIYPQLSSSHFESEVQVVALTIHIDSQPYCF